MPILRKRSLESIQMMMSKIWYITVLESENFKIGKYCSRPDFAFDKVKAMQISEIYRLKFTFSWNTSLFCTYSNEELKRKK